MNAATQQPTIAARDQLACRVRWHAGPCEVVTYSDGTHAHLTHGEPSGTHNVWACELCGCGGRR